MVQTLPPIGGALIRSPRDAEQAACNWLRAVGYRDAVVTNGGADGGIDVTATGAVAQVKAEMVKTGRPVVQALHGIAAVRGVVGYVFSLAGFTQQAVAWADEAGVRLLQFDLQGEPKPCNRPTAVMADTNRVTALPGPLTTGDPFSTLGLAATLTQVDTKTTGWVGDTLVWSFWLVYWEPERAAISIVVPYGSLGIRPNILEGWDLKQDVAAYIADGASPVEACKAGSAELDRVFAASGIPIEEVRVAVGEVDPLLRNGPVAQHLSWPHTTVEPADALRVAATLLRYDQVFGAFTSPAMSSLPQVDAGRAKLVIAWGLGRAYELESAWGANVAVGTLYWEAFQPVSKQSLPDFLSYIRWSDVAKWDPEQRLASFFFLGTSAEQAAQRAVAELDTIFSYLDVPWRAAFVVAGQY